MNSVFAHLIKHELIQQLTSMQILQDKKWKTVLMSCLYVMILIVGALYIAGSTYGLCLLGNLESVMPIFLNAVTMIVLITTLMKAGHQLYGAKDIPMLLSFPISLRKILISKCISTFLVSWIVSLVFLVPSSLILAVLYGQWTFLMMNILCSPFVVLIPMSIGMLLSSFVFMLSSKVKNTTLMTVILLCALMLFLPSLINLLSSAEQIIELTQQLSSAISYNPLTSLMNNAINGHISSVIILVVSALCCIMTVLEIITRNYLKVHSSMQNSEKRVFSYRRQHSASIMKALVQREFRHYFSSSLYVANTIIGLILGVVIVVSLWFIPLDDMLVLLGLPIQSNQLKLMFPVIFAMVCGMCCTTACSLSLEGKSLWLIQSLPVSDSHIKASKVLMNLILNLPVVVLGSLLMSLRLKFSGIELFMGLLIPVCICIFSAVTGMLANVLFQNYSWTSEVQVIKQGLPVLIGIFVPMIVCVGFVALVIAKKGQWMLMMVCIVVLILSAVEWRIVQRIPIEG